MTGCWRFSVHNLLTLPWLVSCWGHTTSRAFAGEPRGTLRVLLVNRGQPATAYKESGWYHETRLVWFSQIIRFNCQRHGFYQAFKMLWMYLDLGLCLERISWSGKKSLDFVGWVVLSWQSWHVMTISGHFWHGKELVAPPAPPPPDDGNPQSPPAAPSPSRRTRHKVSALMEPGQNAVLQTFTSTSFLSLF